MPSPEDLASLALEQSDTLTRPGRATRLLWLSQFQTESTVLIGRMESLELLEQARVCYLHGLYIAAILTATACIEQTLVEELEYQKSKSPRHTFALSIAAARRAMILPKEVLDDADKLRKVRNPLSHKTNDKNEHRLPVRMRKEKRHPRSILEAESQAAIQTMYAVFYGTLKSA